MPRIDLEISGTIIKLRSDRIVIGRGSSCDVQLEDDRVSRHHAELWVKDGAWVIEDLGSTNGTLVAGAEIKGAVVVHPGVVVQIGESGPMLTIASTTLEAQAPGANPSDSDRSLIQARTDVRKAPRVSTPLPTLEATGKASASSRRVGFFLLLVTVAALAAWFGRDVLSEWGTRTFHQIQGLLEEDSPPPAEAAEIGAVTREIPSAEIRSHKASLEELRRDTLPHDAAPAADHVLRRWAASNFSAYRPEGKLDRAALRLQPHAVVENPELILRKNASSPGRVDTWIRGELSAIKRPFLIRLYERPHKISKTADLIAVGQDPSSCVALLTDSDRGEAWGLEVYCTVSLQRGLAENLDGPPPGRKRGLAGARVASVPRPTRAFRLDSPTAVFTSWDASDLPSEIPSVIWPGRRQSISTVKIAESEVPVFMTINDRTEVCGEIEITKSIPQIRHEGALYRFLSPREFQAGERVPAIGDAMEARSVRNLP